MKKVLKTVVAVAIFGLVAGFFGCSNSAGGSSGSAGSGTENAGGGSDTTGGGSDTTGGGNGTAQPEQEGTTLVVWSCSDDLKTIINDYYKPEHTGVTVDFTLVDKSQFSTKLDAAHWPRSTSEALIRPQFRRLSSTGTHSSRQPVILKRPLAESA